ncbi:MAG: hypothetical protein JW846_07785 [Dehalococcoidia bacterium]|nr:hypothetical protein [Dehalococcoidia bacterium]
MEMDERIRDAMLRTELVRSPRRRLSTFGSTTVDYYVVTELAESMSAVRDGKVFAERPKIVTPYYLLHLEGFGEGSRRYLEMMSEEHGRQPGIFYSYRNEPSSMSVVSEPVAVVLGNMNARLDSENTPLSAIIRGVEDVWDLAVMMFVYDLTMRAVGGHAAEFQRRGLLDVDASGVPTAARQQIESLFAMVRSDHSRASDLVTELKRWGVYEEYEDRFLSLFRK